MNSAEVDALRLVAESVFCVQNVYRYISSHCHLPFDFASDPVCRLRRCPLPPRPVGYGRLLPRCGDGDSFLSRGNPSGAHIRVSRKIVGVRREVPHRGSAETITAEALRYNVMLLQSCCTMYEPRTESTLCLVWCCGPNGHYCQQIASSDALKTRSCIVCFLSLCPAWFITVPTLAMVLQLLCCCAVTVLQLLEACTDVHSSTSILQGIN